MTNRTIGHHIQPLQPMVTDDCRVVGGDGSAGAWLALRPTKNGGAAPMRGAYAPHTPGAPIVSVAESNRMVNGVNMSDVSENEPVNQYV